ncbi:TetR/AcrR family transcriptional regulator [Listeria innocua]|uniref:TetR/AcrR family transcriptional regulator n=1 Tax=Listeria innocua TaxID=1642 RepID=UPI00162353DD|nr:TetR/AcrR family transcriptional regulator [Listeria innocua]EHK4067715.1 TetR/AcrR family transcriptional regulator [Listeria monocytogenes]MBC1339362.1 TetR/AcrR family transcriptional regulator [Listeria innocua]MBC1353549.1 TetR/AcrR family transcriptional regulator [Listeria innocua]MBC2137633.1 TetR/AcrR family transcriptional regulator [Listeria innocua]
MLEKKAYHKKNLKEKILETTITLVEKEGFQNVSTRKIAKELGISSTAIYRHYPSLEDLFSKVIIRLSTILAKKLNQNINEKFSAKSCLEKVGIDFVHFSMEKTHFFNLLFLSPYSPKRIFESETTLIEFPTISLFLQLVNRMIKENKLAIEPPLLFVQLWSFILGYSMLVREGNVLFEQSVIQHTIQCLIPKEATQ